jgi:uncharacterized membrane protein YfcA
LEVIVGFAIALAIALTGVGAGSMTTPILIVFLRVPPAVAVGTSLVFGAVVKVVAIPTYAWRRQVNARLLTLLLAGGIPGVLIGSVALNKLKNGPHQALLYTALGLIIAATAAFRLYRTYRPKRQTALTPDKSRWLPWLAFPIGAEVGFSSAGAGALGSLILLAFKNLTAAEVIGTDLCFGLGLSAVGSFIQVGAGNYDAALLLQLVIGGIAGAITGSVLAGRIAQRPLRVTLLVALIVLGFQLALHRA